MGLPNFEKLKLDRTRQISRARWNAAINAMAALVMTAGPGIRISYVGARGSISATGRRGGGSISHPFQGTYRRDAATGDLLVNIRLGRVYGVRAAAAEEVPLLEAAGPSLDADPTPTTNLGGTPAAGDHRWFLQVKIDCANDEIGATPVVLYKSPAAADPTRVDHTVGGSCTDGEYYWEIYRQRWAAGVLANEWQQVFWNGEVQICGPAVVHLVPGA